MYKDLLSRLGCSQETLASVSDGATGEYLQHEAPAEVREIVLAARALLSEIGVEQKVIACSRDVIRNYGGEIGSLSHERVIVLGVSGKNRVSRVLRFEGSGNSCPVDISGILREMIRSNCTGMLLMHNHPSGDSLPSQHDIALTCSLFDAGKAVGVPLMDHIIVSINGSFSFLDAGILAQQK